MFQLRLASCSEISNIGKSFQNKNEKSSFITVKRQKYLMRQSESYHGASTQSTIASAISSVSSALSYPRRDTKRSTETERIWNVSAAETLTTPRARQVKDPAGASIFVSLRPLNPGTDLEAIEACEARKRVSAFMTMQGRSLPISCHLKMLLPWIGHPFSPLRRGQQDAMRWKMAFCRPNDV